MDLSPVEIRVLGCLLEKQRTTPDAYPLTLNSLRLACNQSTNRDPVVDYDETTLRDALHRLERRGWARLASGAGSRASKYRHLLAERVPLDDGQQAVMCVLMLRGPQTPGELAQRADRMHRFPSLAEVQQTLEGLIERELVARLERRPGQKEARYAQLLGADYEDASAPSGVAREAFPAPPEQPAGAADVAEGAEVADAADAAETAGAEPVPGSGGLQALAQLQERVEALERQLARLSAELGVSVEND